MQRDLYPALMLFPAEKKKPILYEGDMAVTDVIEFMAIHGKNSRHLIKEKGTILFLFSVGLIHLLVKNCSSWQVLLC